MKKLIGGAVLAGVIASTAPAMAEAAERPPLTPKDPNPPPRDTPPPPRSPR